MNNTVLILASGMGKRMKAGKNKVFLEINQKPILYYTIKNFELSSVIQNIVLVLKQEEVDFVRKLIKKYDFKKVKDVIIGGKERQDSSYNGLNFVHKNYNTKDAIIVFHNGANPFVTQSEIENVISEASKFGAAVVAHKTKDTIRKVDSDSFSGGIIEREKLWNMQTPQAIQLNLAKKSFDYAFENNFVATDDCSMVENYGVSVKIIEASENNFKITTPLDLKLAKVILREKINLNKSI